jgi:predicted HTH domain antitoxin
MKTITLELPDDLSEDLARFGDRSREIFLLGLSQLKIQEALLLYGRGVVSFARAAELAGISRDALILHARAQGIEPQWSEDMLAEELA